MINNLKTDYEDYWKDLNRVNTSIKLMLTVKIKGFDNLRISEFEKILNKTDLIYNYQISNLIKILSFIE